jgi:PAS domain-containing protein
VGLAEAAIRGIADSVTFRASTAPYLLLDVDLRIRAANDAYQAATHHGIAEMAGELMFEVFPDNPSVPEVRSVELLGRSFERALSRGGSDRMGLQRYDVIARERDVFVQKTWLPVNTAIRDPEGRTVGILHHVEDVTRLLGTTALEDDLLGAPGRVRARPAGTASSAEALRRDSLERRAHAEALLGESRQALERMARRIGADQDEGRERGRRHRPPAG